VRRWFERLFLLAGLGALGTWAWFTIGADLWQDYQDRQFERALEGRQEEHHPAPPASHVAPGTVVGRLSIPRLRVRSIVREGDGNGVLSLALGHIPGTALPGQPGNIGVAGHRDTLFRELRNISPRDQIVLQTLDKRYVYQVEGTRIVKPANIDVLDPGSKPELTLVTCYPFQYIGAAPDRFIVKARLVPDATTTTEASAVQADASPAPAAPAHFGKKPEQADVGRVTFSVPSGHSRELVNGKVWFGLTHADPSDQRVDGWLWIMPSRRTVWLRDKDTRAPIFFQSDGGEFELVLTRVSGASAAGYLVKPHSARRVADRLVAEAR
jgi:sortase A